MTPDPLKRMRLWLAAERRGGSVLPEAAALATADRRGRPSVRYVLIKAVETNGVVFYTNASSRKGRELAENPYASLAVYWDGSGRQVRVEGRTSTVTIAEADAYWQERPPGSRIASAVSQQSATIGSRAELMARYRELERSHPDGDIPRPKHWIGYRIRPDHVEFWTRAEPRLHKRELFTRRGKVWSARILQP